MFKWLFGNGQESEERELLQNILDQVNLIPNGVITKTTERSEETWEERSMPIHTFRVVIAEDVTVEGIDLSYIGYHDINVRSNTSYITKSARYRSNVGNDRLVWAIVEAMKAKYTTAENERLQRGECDEKIRHGYSVSELLKKLK